MSIFVDKNTRLLVQGITGNEGTFHTRQCIEYGTNVVAGVTPGKGGQNNGQCAGFQFRPGRGRADPGQLQHDLCAAPFAADAILEAVDAGIEAALLPLQKVFR